ncbi:MAG: hypothetical protein ACE5IR_14875 [bacterium]
MKNKIGKCLFSMLLLLFLNSTGYSQFHSLETRNLKLLYYSKAHEFIVPHLARCFENSLKFHRNLFKYSPSEKITVLLQDFGDYGNAGATTVPQNLVFVGIAPFSYDYENKTANERMNMLMNHELVHITASDQAAGSDNFFRSLFFGKVAATADQPVSMIYSYLTNPRWYSPRWYHEGIAVFMETWMSGGLGRALGAYDEMVFRTMVRDNSYIYDLVGLESEGTTIDFQVGANSYFYGTRFMSYLAHKFGPQEVIKWVARSKGSKKYFASQFKNVFGGSLADEWSRWITWEQQFQQANLDSIRLYPTTPYRQISRQPLGAVSHAFYDSASRKLLAAIAYPGQLAHIAAIDLDTGVIDKICNIKGSALRYVTSLTYDPEPHTLFYTTDNNHWRDLNAVDIRTGVSKMLIKDVRTGDLAFNEADKSIWGVRHFNGISTLVRIPPPYKEWNQIYSFPYGKDIFDIDVSPDVTKITGALAEVDGSQRLIKMNIAELLNGDTGYEVLFDFELSTPANFTFTSDNRSLYGSSYYSGVSNIYKYDFEKEDMTIISNCETGFFRPIPVSNDSLIVFRFTGKGFVPVMIPNRSPEFVSATKFLGNEIAKKYSTVRAWTLGSPALINIDSLTTSTGKYHTLKNISFASAYPIVEGYKDFAAVGMRFDFSDKLAISRFAVTASYSPDQDLPRDERVHVKFDLHHWNWGFTARYNSADFYDLFGPTKTSRKGYSLGLKYKKTLISDQPKTFDFNLSVTGYGNLETLPDFQNVSATFDKLLSATASLNYHFLWKSLGAVDDEKGVRWELVSHNNYVNSTVFPRLYSNFDYGILLPLNHSSVWLRSSIGYSFGESGNPFANFFFGGFGNNHIDHLSEKRYLEFYSFPGVGLNEFGGKNYGKVMLEWTVPPLRFRRFGFSGLYLRWARLAFFTSGIRTNFGKNQASQPLPQFGAQRTLMNFGGQVDFRMVLFSSLKTTLSFGYAAALEKGDLSDEFMVSLKIL